MLVANAPRVAGIPSRSEERSHNEGSLQTAWTDSYRRETLGRGERESEGGWREREREREIERERM